ncbi:MAG: cytochrome c [Chromatiaceae bacterium]|nr:cytochrome c [Chromatiaceae bacterium]MCF8017414.1 cytochrome c [Chromatiaceae bacterium]
MIQRFLLNLTAASLITIGMHAQAEDAVDAQALFDQNCTSCHGSEVYTRDDRRIGSLDALHGQVRMCEQNLNLTWFDDQVDAVTALLNREYYKFEP